MRAKKVTLIGIILVLMMVFSVPAFAEESSKSPSSSSNSLDVSPIEQGRINSGMKEMGDDLSGFGQSIAFPLFIFGLISSVILLLIGIFSKKALAAGGIALVASFASLLLLGDVSKATDIMNHIATTIRDYF